MTAVITDSFEKLDVNLDRDGFFRTLLRHLAGNLEQIVGLDEASGFIAMVGAHMGDDMNRMYRQALSKDKLNTAEVGRALVDLKRRIHGGFRLVEATDKQLVFENTACPFGTAVAGRPSLCMMTSNVFGRIAAENLGYARVRIEKSIAAGDAGCRVVVALQPAENPPGPREREYFQIEP
jgi:predicted ArsR family transcriptional regulator